MKWVALIRYPALVVIGVATLTPLPGQGASAALTPWWCLLCGGIGLADLIQNVILFLPLGASLAAGGWSPYRAAAMAFLVSGGVELAQYHIIPGRDASLGDLLANTLGGIGGAQLVFLAPWTREAAMTALRWHLLLLLGIGGWLCTVLLIPTVPGSRWVWFSDPPPPTPHLVPFPGTIVRADPVPSAATEQFTLRAVVIPDSFSSRRSAILAAFDRSGAQEVLLEQRAARLTLSVRRDATSLTLRSIDASVNLDRVASPGDTIIIEGSWDRAGRIALSAQGPRGRAERIATVTPARWWILLWPFGDVSARLALWLDAATLLGVALLAGLTSNRRWLGVPEGGAVPHGVSAAVLLWLVWGVPLAAHLPPASLLLWSVGIVGLGLGWWGGGRR